jgi:hypothetical protein
VAEEGVHPYSPGQVAKILAGKGIWLGNSTKVKGKKKLRKKIKRSE